MRNAFTAPPSELHASGHRQFPPEELVLPPLEQENQQRTEERLLSSDVLLDW